MKYSIAIWAVALGLSVQPVVADDDYERERKVRQCNQIKDRIEHYTKLRRAGGSSSQMEYYRRYRNEAKQEYSDLRCRDLTGPA